MPCKDKNIVAFGLTRQRKKPEIALGCTVLIFVFASDEFSRNFVTCYERQEKACFPLVTPTVPLLVSLGAQYLWEGLCVGCLAKTFIVLTCWGFVSVGTCMSMCMNTCMVVQAYTNCPRAPGAATWKVSRPPLEYWVCLLYTSDAADE